MVVDLWESSSGHPGAQWGLPCVAELPRVLDVGVQLQTSSTHCGSLSHFLSSIRNIFSPPVTPSYALMCRGEKMTPTFFFF